MKDSWPQAVAVLAAGGSFEDAARAAGVDKRTVARWKADEPTFADALAEVRSQMIEQASGILTASCASWAQTLADLAADVEVAPQFRIAAARAGLEHASRYRQDTMIEERLRDLEIAAGLRRKATV